MISFTLYLIIDRKMPAMEAIFESWAMTQGHTLTFLGYVVLSMFIGFGGLLCFIVGVIPAVI